ncbi:hypothetical protein FPV67DRAFT_1372191, partial [Lyophyllum atratum]
PVEKLSGQKPGEDWKSFFSRREQANNQKYESPMERQRREQREANACRQVAPGKRGARVYVWDDVDGYLIRKAAGRRHIDDIWEDYGTKQRKYDAFRDEWDLCYEFGEDDPESDEEREGLHSSVSDLQRIHNDEEESYKEAYRFCDASEDRAYYRFGFVDPPSVVPHLSTGLVTTWSLAREFLGNGLWLDVSVHSPHSTPSTTIQNSMCNFFDYFLASSGIWEIPSAFYDARFQSPDLEFFHVRSEVYQGVKYYFLRPAPSMVTKNIHWELALTSAAAVVEVLRHQWRLDLVGLARELLGRGIQFKTCLSGPLTPPPAGVPQRFNGLGYRPSNYKPDKTDYDTYEDTRNKFLRSQRGRAALLYGGIISRLAKDIAPYQHVFDGPTQDVLENGVLISGKDSGYWDDAMTEHEINLICGVYKVDTG